MKRGPAPKPTSLKLIAGNPGRRPLAEGEARPKITEPDCPDHLSDDARAEWQRVMPLLVKNFLVTELDSASLALYCQSYGRWKEAERAIDAQRAKGGDGMLVKAPSGYPIQNPYLAIANRAMEDCYKYLQQFGLSPSARTRVQASPQGDLFGYGSDDKKQAGAGRFFT
jgi:P27 family predicted phage terminase small subunit